MKLNDLFKEKGLLSGKRVLAIVSSLTLVIGFTLGASAGSHTWGSTGNIEYMDPDTGAKTTVFDKSDLDYLDNRITEVETEVSDGKKQIAEELNTWDLATEKILSTENPTFEQILDTMGYIKSTPNAGEPWLDADGNQNYLMENGLVTTNVDDAKKDAEGNAEALTIAAAQPENLSAGTAAWVNGDFIIGTGADNNSYYDKKRPKKIAIGKLDPLSGNDYTSRGNSVTSKIDVTNIAHSYGIDPQSLNADDFLISSFLINVYADISMGNSTKWISPTIVYKAPYVWVQSVYYSPGTDRAISAKSIMVQLIQ